LWPVPVDDREFQYGTGSLRMVARHLQTYRTLRYDRYMACGAGTVPVNGKPLMVAVDNEKILDMLVSNAQMLPRAKFVDWSSEDIMIHYSMTSSPPRVTSFSYVCYITSFLRLPVPVVQLDSFDSLDRVSSSPHEPHPCAPTPKAQAGSLVGALNSRFKTNPPNHTKPIRVISGHRPLRTFLHVSAS